MSEINRDRARAGIAECCEHHYNDLNPHGLIECILSISELAIVNREAKLPLLTDDWIGEGWVKEIE